jgi:hypothetical protein
VAIQNTPLTQETKYKVTILDIYNRIKHIEFGIITKDKYNETIDTLIQSPSDNEICYWGLGASNFNVSQNYFNSGNRLNVNTVIYLHFKPREFFKIYNDSKSINLEKSLSNNTNIYYIYTALKYH